jgi:hypothetical protein
MYDCGGQAITYPALMAPVDGGWVAIDTVGSAVRAVIEVQVPTDDPGPGVWTPPSLALRVGLRGQLSPSRVRQGEHTCRYLAPDRAQCRDLNGDPDRCVIGAPEERCFYAVRAEFVLDEVPELSDLAVLTVGEATSYVLAWRRD